MNTASIHNFTLWTVMLPLVGSAIAGLLGKVIGRTATHRVTILLVFIAFLCACVLGNAYFFGDAKPVDVTLYSWLSSGSFTFHVGFLIDRLTVLMLLVVTFVSTLVHIYTIGYMHDDPGYQRFFSYVSLFTFMMLMLVTANNFAQLFFGWEGVGLVSYLLIGFWFKKESAAQGSLKAFLVNRIGDVGLIIALSAILCYFGSLDYSVVFAQAATKVQVMVPVLSGVSWPLITAICIFLFIGAMGKSAQVPLHVWLPSSMEGPTPISALIHAATMVTAGVFMIARLSPLFELSTTALSTVMIFGALGALFLGLLALAEFDIKRVIAYSTMSQLGYMMVGNGASAYSAAMFHLMTHACFKALLFLAAGSVIIAMHHEQDMRKMGGLWKRMPITYATFLIGSLALVAIPPFSGFYSKDAIIEAVGASTLFGAHFAYWCVLIGALVTALYSFRALFMTFHGKARYDEAHHPAKESPWVVTLPLILLAIPSIFIGMPLVKSMLYSGAQNLFHDSIMVLPAHNVLGELAREFEGAGHAVWAAFATVPFWFAVMGVVLAWYLYYLKPALATKIAERFPRLRAVLVAEYGFDAFNDRVFVRGLQRLSQYFYTVTDQRWVDQRLVTGTARFMTTLSRVLKKVQSGYLCHYAMITVVALLVLLIWMMS